MQKNISQKLVSVLLYLILAVSVVLLGIFYYKVSGATFSVEKPDFKEQLAVYGTIVDLFIGWAYVLIGIATLAAIIPSVMQLISQPKNAVKSLISIAVLALFIFIAYSLSDGTPFTSKELPAYTGHDNVPGTLRFADTMIFTMYFLLAGAFISIIYAEIAKVFK